MIAGRSIKNKKILEISVFEWLYFFFNFSSSVAQVNPVPTTYNIHDTKGLKLLT